MSVTVTLRQSGRTLSWDPEEDDSFWEFLKAEGVWIPHLCQVGSDGECEIRLVSGAVEYSMPPEHTPRPGCFLPCVARPSCDVVIDA